MNHDLQQQTFRIGDFCFALRYNFPLSIPENFQLFRTDSDVPAYFYELTIADTLPALPGSPIFHRDDLAVYFGGPLESRLIGVHGMPGYYACYQEVSENTAQITLAAEYLAELQCDPGFCSIFALERRLLQHQSLVLHCAYIRYRGEAILFSAPSETGKTTQANLWEQYRGSETINGDRGLLHADGSGWIVSGWPVCGTSECCHNQSDPLRAIVMLRQAKTDAVRRLPAGQAFSQLYSQITINRWNTAQQQQALNLIEQLIRSIPVYELSCTISENAVACLHQMLYNENTADISAP